MLAAIAIVSPIEQVFPPSSAQSRPEPSSRAPCLDHPRRTKPRGARSHKTLSGAFVPSAPPGRHADVNGLFLYGQPTGTRNWIQRFVVGGGRRELGPGSIHLITLAEAREAARANRELARSGGDPLAERHRARTVSSASL